MGKYEAFVPAPLPPKVEWTPRLIRVLSDADRLIGNLAGEGGRLPNPHVLMRPFVKREAVLSSKIEGTQATLGEILAAEAGVTVDRSPEDLREVGNYIIALEHGIARLKELPLCVRIIRELHEQTDDWCSWRTSQAGTLPHNPELDWQAGQHAGDGVLHSTAAGGSGAVPGRVGEVRA